MDTLAVSVVAPPVPPPDRCPICARYALLFPLHAAQAPIVCAVHGFVQDDVQDDIQDMVES